jgi:transcriptional regulator with XRE-family HTH domain
MAARGRSRGGKPLESRVLEIGPKLKDARTKEGLSLRVLATRTGFSASFLSQVELGQASPSLASLGRIAEALGIQLSALFGDANAYASPVIHRHDERVVRSGWSQATLRILLAAAPGQPVSAMLVALDPGGQSGKSPRTQRGRVFAFCVSGALLLETPVETFELVQGDSISYQASTLASVWRNAGAEVAEVLIVSLPD